MDDFASDTDSDYTSYWRDWVSAPSYIPQLDADACSPGAMDMLREVARKFWEFATPCARYVGGEDSRSRHGTRLLARANEMLDTDCYPNPLTRSTYHKNHGELLYASSAVCSARPDPCVGLSGSRGTRHVPRHDGCLYGPRLLGLGSVSKSYWYLSTLTRNVVHLVKGQRVLLRDRRGLLDRPLQPHWPKHRGPVLPVCAGSRN